MNAEIRIESAQPKVKSLLGGGFLAQAAIVFLMIGGFACLGGRSNPDDSAMDDPQARAERIQELRQGIDRDHATLEELIARPRGPEEAKLHDDPELRAIAGRMNDQVRALESLEAEQDEPEAVK